MMQCSTILKEALEDLKPAAFGQSSSVWHAEAVDRWGCLGAATLSVRMCWQLQRLANAWTQGFRPLQKAWSASKPCAGNARRSGELVAMVAGVTAMWWFVHQCTPWGTKRWTIFFHKLRQRIRPKLVAYSAMWNIIDTQRRTEATRCGITAVDPDTSWYSRWVQHGSRLFSVVHYVHWPCWKLATCSYL